MKYNIGVIGLGYVGLPFLIACAKEKKFFSKVIGLEKKNKKGKLKIDQLKKGKFPIKVEDPDLIKYFKKNKNFLKFSTNIKCLHDLDFVLLCLPVNINKNLNLNFDYFYKDFKEIYLNLKKNCVIIITSTVPPGFTKNIIHKLKIDKIYEKNKSIVYSPERVVPGSSYLNSVINSHRVFSSNQDKFISKKIKNLFDVIFNTKRFKSVELNLYEEAEFCKILENSYRAANIAFMEEWGKFAMDLKINIYDVLKAIKLRPTHNNIMRPGLGVGGYCLTKDPYFAKYALSNYIRKKNYFQLIDIFMNINHLMPKYSFEIFKKNLHKSKKNFNLILGITYIENVDDIRNSPSLQFIKYLKKYKFSYDIYDPVFSGDRFAEKKILKKNVNLNAYDNLIFLVRHKKLQQINFKKIKKNIKIFDFNNVLTPLQIKQIYKEGIYLKVLGRGDI